ncbi:DMT family transporter [Paracoccus marinaquae]|uniref:DMT family transporter n=1 Tax=Paracoccus marinaquae TaxID=2841926 RepID=A0ABS6AMS7_9RHOB|nr:DMT family transporter [Paracoccus marinaquae]MBU3031903.1 DMT family transporter [Paracoccus marinaquae]
MRIPTLPGNGTGMTLLCLMITGSALAVTILISGAAADAGTPMLWFLTAVLALSGLVQLAAIAPSLRLRDLVRLLPYSLGAGAFMVVPSALGYLAVAHVGAGYISLSFAFPILLTWALARIMGIEPRDRRRALGVLLGLAGGLLLAASKFGMIDGGAIGWLIAATAMPVIVALGNIYRSRYWPRGAGAALLSPLMLLAGAALILPLALWLEGSPAPLWTGAGLRLLLIVDVAVFVVQYYAYFTLQRIGGPVTLSLIGPVAALVGSGAAVWLFGEALPGGFVLAGLLVAAGTVLMLRRPPQSQGSFQASTIPTASSAVST